MAEVSVLLNPRSLKECNRSLLLRAIGEPEQGLNVSRACVSQILCECLSFRVLWLFLVDHLRFGATSCQKQIKLWNWKDFAHKLLS